MSETNSAAPEIVVVQSIGISRRAKKILIVILVIALIVALVYYFFWPHLSMKKVRSMVAVDSSEYTVGNSATSDPASVENILLQGVKEIRWDRQLYKQAKIFAKAQNMEIERVIVDSAIALALNYGYITKI